MLAETIILFFIVIVIIVIFIFSFETENFHWKRKEIGTVDGGNNVSTNIKICKTTSKKIQYISKLENMNSLFHY